MILPNFDNTKDFETFHNIDDIQIIKINTNDSAKYIARMKQWYEELKEYTDINGRHKVIHVYFKAPPLSSILSFIEVPLPQEFKWTAVAIIEPQDSVVAKFNPIINWAARLNKNKNRVATRLYDHDYLKRIDEVKNWLEEQMKNGPNENKILEY